MQSLEKKIDDMSGQLESLLNLYKFLGEKVNDLEYSIPREITQRQMFKDEPILNELGKIESAMKSTSQNLRLVNGNVVLGLKRVGAVYNRTVEIAGCVRKNIEATSTVANDVKDISESERTIINGLKAHSETAMTFNHNFKANSEAITTLTEIINTNREIATTLSNNVKENSDATTTLTNNVKANSKATTTLGNNIKENPQVATTLTNTTKTLINDLKAYTSYLGTVIETNQEVHSINNSILSQSILQVSENVEDIKLMTRKQLKMSRSVSRDVKENSQSIRKLPDKQYFLERLYPKFWDANVLMTRRCKTDVIESMELIVQNECGLVKSGISQSMDELMEKLKEPTPTSSPSPSPSPSPKPAAVLDELEVGERFYSPTPSNFDEYDPLSGTPRKGGDLPWISPQNTFRKSTPPEPIFSKPPKFKVQAKLNTDRGSMIPSGSNVSVGLGARPGVIVESRPFAPESILSPVRASSRAPGIALEFVPAPAPAPAPVPEPEPEPEPALDPLDALVDENRPAKRPRLDNSRILDIGYAFSKGKSRRVRPIALNVGLPNVIEKLILEKDKHFPKNRKRNLDSNKNGAICWLSQVMGLPLVDWDKEKECDNCREARSRGEDVVCFYYQTLKTICFFKENEE